MPTTVGSNWPESSPGTRLRKEYASKFTGFKGNVAKPARLAFGSLFIQTMLDLRDRECAETIAENPYIQYFLGFSEFQPTPPVSASTFVYFRKRIKAAGMARINDILCGISKDDDNDQDPPEEGGDNDGTLILDATCAPQDIRYPTDLILLNEAREMLERFITKVFQPFRGQLKKPKMDMKNARKSFLSIVKQRKWKYNQMRSAIKKQLKYVRLDLKSLDQLLSMPGHGQLSELELTKLATIPSSRSRCSRAEPIAWMTALSVSPSRIFANCPRKSRTQCRIRRQDLDQRQGWLHLCRQNRLGQFQ